ncbi:MAG: winged helix-turn-helix transcriptional regulator [Nitrososphaerota archaeon]|nr:winged helix-turn-helix transcriptional regulator [Nitrososphaerota archaeon]
MRGRRTWEVYLAHAEFCKTFSHPVRLAMLDGLRGGEKTVSDLVDETGVTQSTVSQQLSLLRRLGIVRPRRDGRRVYYRLTDKRVLKAYDLVDAVVKETTTDQARILA